MLGSNSSLSSIGKKVGMALTGIALMFFLLAHLAGNLSLLTGNPDLFNSYSHKLISLGPLLILAEIMLLAFFFIHLISGITVFLKKRKARPIGYNYIGAAGGASRKSLSSTTMIFSGIVLLLFVVIHLKTFKYGAHYETEVGGVLMRDLHRLVVEKFSHLEYVIGYVLTMLVLGLHLRHGFSSALQSLGVHHPKFTPLFYGVGAVFAVLLSVGFLALPIWIYFTGAGV